MNEKSNNLQTKSDTKKVVIITISIILAVFTGIFGFVIGMANIENYKHPYLFGLVLGFIGLLIGLLTAKKIKRFITINHHISNNYYIITIYIVVGFIGSFIWIGSKINKSTSSIDYCDRFIVVDKIRIEKRAKQPESNKLYIKVLNEKIPLLCHPDYWDKIQIGQQINVCLYKSIFGFNFMILEDDKKKQVNF